MRDPTLDRWRERFDRALRLLAGSLDEPPPLEAMAAAAAVSPFHFHRMWRALTGETVGETVARLRLESAAEALGSADAPVTAVAMEAGYATPQAFARALRREAGVTPSALRAGASFSLAAPANAPIEIVRLDPVTVIAKRREGGPYEALNVEFGAVWAWAEGAGFADRLQGLYGVPYDDPASVPVDRLRYDACMAFAAEAEPPPHLDRLILPGGAFARLRHVGSYAGLDAATQALWAWLLESGREPAEAPVIHHFHNDPETTAEADLVTDILLKLEPQDA